MVVHFPLTFYTGPRLGTSECPFRFCYKNLCRKLELKYIHLDCTTTLAVLSSPPSSLFLTSQVLLLERLQTKQAQIENTEHIFNCEADELLQQGEQRLLWVFASRLDPFLKGIFSRSISHCFKYRDNQSLTLLSGLQIYSSKTTQKVNWKTYVTGQLQKPHFLSPACPSDTSSHPVREQRESLTNSTEAMSSVRCLWWMLETNSWS